MNTKTSKPPWEQNYGEIKRDFLDKFRGTSGAPSERELVQIHIKWRRLAAEA